MSWLGNSQISGVVVRRTRGQLAVATVLLADPVGQHYGYQLMRATGEASGLIYQILGRWTRTGLLAGNRERSPYYYTLTDKGRAELSALVNGER